MKIQEQNVLVLRMWQWVSLGINLLFSSIAGYVVYHVKDLLLIGIILFLAVGVVAYFRIRLDISQKEFSSSATIINYSVTFFVSCVMVYILYIKASLLWALILFGIIIFESLVAIILIFRYRILNFFKRKMQNTRK